MIIYSVYRFVDLGATSAEGHLVAGDCLVSQGKHRRQNGDRERAHLAFITDLLLRYLIAN